MSIPNGERLMMRLMVNIEASDDEILAVLLLLRTTNERLEMLLWLKRNRNATPSDMLKEATRIKREMRNNEPRHRYIP